MTTWTSKTTLAATALGLLGACGAGPAVENTALARAQMGFGAVNLVPPPGYCIDESNLSEDFAVIARCDVLGSPEELSDTPLGLIAVSLSEAGEETPLPSPQQTAAAHGLSDISDETTGENRVIFRAKGKAPSRQMSDDHWRASALVAGYVIGVALYAPKGGAAAASEGRNLIATLLDQTQPTE
jgi:hypothetical protein